MRTAWAAFLSVQHEDRACCARHLLFASSVSLTTPCTFNTLLPVLRSQPRLHSPTFSVACPTCSESLGELPAHATALMSCNGLRISCALRVASSGGHSPVVDLKGRGPASRFLGRQPRRSPLQQLGWRQAVAATEPAPADRREASAAAAPQPLTAAQQQQQLQAQQAQQRKEQQQQRVGKGTVIGAVSLIVGNTVGAGAPSPPCPPARRGNTCALPCLEARPCHHAIGAATCWAALRCGTQSTPATALLPATRHAGAAGSVCACRHPANLARPDRHLGAAHARRAADRRSEPGGARGS